MVLLGSRAWGALTVFSDHSNVDVYQMLQGGTCTCTHTSNLYGNVCMATNIGSPSVAGTTSWELGLERRVDLELFQVTETVYLNPRWC